MLLISYLKILQKQLRKKHLNTSNVINKQQIWHTMELSTKNLNTSNVINKLQSVACTISVQPYLNTSNVINKRPPYPLEKIGA